MLAVTRAVVVRAVMYVAVRVVVRTAVVRLVRVTPTPDTTHPNAVAIRALHTRGIGIVDECGPTNREMRGVPEHLHDEQPGCAARRGVRITR